MFGNQNTFGNATSPFANNPQPNSSSPFSNSNSNSSNTLFSSAKTQNSQPQQQNGGFFTGNQQNPTNNTFPANNNTFGTANTGGVFGNVNTFQNQGNNSGAGVWTSSNTTSATGVFGGSNASTNSSTSGMFGNQQQQGNNAPSFGNIGNGGTFGNSSQEKRFQANSFGNSSNSPFGNQQQTQNGLSLNSSFGNNTFGQGGQPQNKFEASSPFGSNNSTFAFNSNQQMNSQTSETNKMGGWGLNGQVQQQGQQGQKFTPVKSKNQKIDHKHLVKCIVNLDQNTGMSLNQLRINFMNGTGKNTNSNSTAFSNPSFGNITQQPSSSPFSLSGTNTFNKPANSPTTSFTSLQNSTNPTNNASSPFKTTNTSNVGFGTTNSSPFGGNSNTSNQPNTSTNGTNFQFGNSSSTTGKSSGLFGGTAGNTFNLGGNGQNQTSGLTSGNNFTSGKSASPFGTTNQNTQGNQPTAFNFSNTNNQTKNLTGTPSSTINGNQTKAQSNQSTTLFGGVSQQQQAPGGGMSALFNNTPSLFGGQVLPHFPVMQSLESIPGADPQILSAIMNIGFYSPEFRSQIKQEKTPFDKLIEDPYVGMEEYKNMSRMSINRIDPDAITNRVNDLSRVKMDYKFKHPYDFGNEECYNNVNFNEEAEIRKTAYRKKVKKEKEEVKPTFDLKENKIHPEFYEKRFKEKDLPIVGDYHITPSLDELRYKKFNELKKVSNVTIENDYGKVTFKEPVSLYKKNISASIEILPNSIDIIDGEWDKKRCEMTFRNFGNFTSQGKEKHEKFYRKMRNWIDKHQMTELDFNSKTGDLLVEL